MFYFQELSLNVHSYLNLSLHGSSSLFDNHWLYQRYNEIFTLKSASFPWCRLNLNGTEWLVEMDWKNFENDRRFFGTVLNTLRANATTKWSNTLKQFVIPFAGGNYSFPQASFSRELFPPTAKRGGGNYDLLYQNSTRENREDLEH